jgi:hypothetical protein
MDLREVYTVFHPTTTQYTFFSAAHGTFSKEMLCSPSEMFSKDMLGHKASLNKHKKIEITPAYFLTTMQ